MRLYVGNLPYGVGDKELSELFSSYGEISEAVVIKEKYSGRSKGFGFVTIVEKEGGEKAVSEMDGKEVQGRAIKVNEARPLDPDGPSKRNFDRR